MNKSPKRGKPRGQALRTGERPAPVIGLGSFPGKAVSTPDGIMVERGGLRLYLDTKIGRLTPFQPQK